MLLYADVASQIAAGAAAFGYLEHRMLIEDMIAAAREGRDPYITAISARGTLATALAMYESAETSRQVTIEH